MTDSTNPQSDPTALTTQMVLREVEILHDSIDDKVDARHREQAAIKELFEANQAEINRIMKEKFRSIETQFDLIERQRVEQKKDTKDAVDAALIAQKEAVQEQTIASGLSIAKSETATAKQLDQLASTMSVAIQGVTTASNELKDNFNISISDIKERIGKIESNKVGANEERAHTKDNITILYSIAGILVGVLTIISILAAGGHLK